MTAVRRSLSVVIPTYNRAALLCDTLSAVLAQDCPADEVIVVDDGSTDNTAEVVAKFGVRFLRQANAGDLVARNTGLAAASTELVAFCDSDDLWHPGFLAAMQSLWQAEPRLLAGFGNFRIIREGTWLPQGKFSSAPPGFWDGLREVGLGLAVFDTPVVDRLIRFQPCFPSALVVDLEHMRDIGGWDESVGRTVGTDFATMLRLAEHAPLGVVQAPLVGIRKHVGNYSADVQSMNLGDALILEHVLSHRPTLQPFASMIKASVAARRGDAFDTAFARSDFASVRAIGRLLSAPGAARQIKMAVATLPAPMGRIAGAALLTLGSLRAQAWRSTASAPDATRPHSQG